MVEQLATYQKLIQSAQLSWDHFLEKRSLRLKQLSRRGGGAEKISENIVEDLLTDVLDWCISNINNQIQYADILLTHVGIKRAIIETKRPTTFLQNNNSIFKALTQARRYADEQSVTTIAVSDGYMLHAADIQNGGIEERLHISLETDKFPIDLYWLSVHGITKQRENYSPILILKPETQVYSDILLHPKYKIPAECFGYAGDTTNTKTWKLPHRKIDGSVDEKRLSGAIRCIISNYRGTNVKGIPDSAIPSVIKRLYQAADEAKKLPHQNPKTAVCYKELASIMKQFA